MRNKPTEIKVKVVENPEVFKNCHDRAKNLVFSEDKGVKAPALHPCQHGRIFWVNPERKGRRRKEEERRRRKERRKRKEKKKIRETN